jgi:uncharacterized membrane protein
LRVLPLALVAASFAWVIVLVSAPLFPAPLAALTYVFGSLICHQRPERSFHLGAAQLPVCARCIGIYAGAACASLGWMLARGSRPRANGMNRIPRSWLILAAAPTIITIVAEWTGVWPISNVVRAAAGAPIGAAVALVVMGALTTLHYDECAPPRPIAPPPPSTHT